MATQEKGGVLARLLGKQKEDPEQELGDRIGAYLAAHGKPPTPRNVQEIMKNPPKAIALDGDRCSAYLDRYLKAAQNRTLAWDSKNNKWVIVE